MAEQREQRKKKHSLTCAIYGDSIPEVKKSIKPVSTESPIAAKEEKEVEFHDTISSIAMEETQNLPKSDSMVVCLSGSPPQPFMLGIAPIDAHNCSKLGRRKSPNLSRRTASSKPMYSEVNKFMRKTPRKPPSSNQVKRKSKAAIKMKSFQGCDVAKEARKFRSVLENQVGKVKLDIGHGQAAPGDTVAHIRAQDALDIVGLLQEMETRILELQRSQAIRSEADRTALASLHQLLQKSEKGLEIDAQEAVAENSQLNLWMQQLTIVKELLAGEMWQPTVENEEANDDKSSREILPADFLPTVAVQTMEVAFGLTRAVRQTLGEGLEAAQSIIAKLETRH